VEIMPKKKKISQERIMAAIANRLTGSPFPFQGGDRVRVNDYPEGGMDDRVRSRSGTVIGGNLFPIGSNFIGVEFDQGSDSLHDCNGRTKPGRGWYVTRKNLRIIFD